MPRLGQREQRRPGYPFQHLAVTQDDLQVAQRDQGVLPGDPLGPCALPQLECLDHPLVVALGDDEDVARFGELGLGQHHRPGTGEGQRQGMLERALEHRAARHLEQASVEAVVEKQVLLERLVVGLVDELGDLLVDRRQRPQVAALGPALGGEARRGALEDAAQLDGIADVVLGELADRVAAAGQFEQEPLVLELGQREAQRRPRDAEAVDQRQLRHPRSGRKLAAQDELAQAQQRAGDLGSRSRIRHRRVGLAETTNESIRTVKAACRSARSDAKVVPLWVC